jgi:hypothetical protein
LAGRPLTAGAVGLDEQRLACWEADALDLYRRLAARLREELGLDPAPELQLLRQRLLRTEG